MIRQDILDELLAERYGPPVRQKTTREKEPPSVSRGQAQRNRRELLLAVTPRRRR